METLGTQYLVPVYVTYAMIAIGLTILLARILSKNGAVFLEDVFRDKPKMAEAVNTLLVVGFYLFNLGYAALMMKADEATNPLKAIEVLAWKLGALLISLGVMHFFNLYVFHRIRRRASLAYLPPPVAPQMSLRQANAEHWGRAWEGDAAARFPDPARTVTP